VAIVKKNIKKLKALAVALLEKEILDSKEIDKILGIRTKQKNSD
jgi:ATP-dependent Zn protease